MIRLQALTRRWLAQQRVARLRRQRDRRLAWLEAMEQGWRREREEQLADRRRRWNNPRRREDFNLLYNALESKNYQIFYYNIIILYLLSPLLIYTAFQSFKRHFTSYTSE